MAGPPDRLQRKFASSLIGTVLAEPGRMLEPTFLAALSIVAITSAPPKLAVADTGGQIHITLDSGTRWQIVHTCAPAPSISDADSTSTGPPSGCATAEHQIAMTWRADTLFGVCSDGALWRWDAPRARARSVVSATHIKAHSLTGNQRELLIADDSGTLWSFTEGQTEGQTVRTAQLPDRSNDLLDTSTGLLLAGRSALWRREPATGGWQMESAARVCALAADSSDSDLIWAVGPDGILRISGQSVHLHGVLPATDIARWNEELLVIDRQHARSVPAHPDDRLQPRLPGRQIAESSEQALGIALGRASARVEGLRLLEHSRFARWLPVVSAKFTLGQRNARRELRFALWLRWVARPTVWSGALP